MPDFLRSRIGCSDQQDTGCLVLLQCDELRCLQAFVFLMSQQENCETLPLRLFLGVTYCFAGLQKLADPNFFSAASSSGWSCRRR